jgi:hypothetical protein
MGHNREFTVATNLALKMKTEYIGINDASHIYSPIFLTSSSYKITFTFFYSAKHR